MPICARMNGQASRTANDSLSVLPVFRRSLTVGPHELFTPAPCWPHRKNGLPGTHGMSGKPFCSPACKPGSVPLAGWRPSIFAPRHRDAPGRSLPRPVPPSRPPLRERPGKPDRFPDRLHGVASDRVYSKSMLPWKWVSSYLAFPPLPSAVRPAVCFCCPFPAVTRG